MKLPGSLLWRTLVVILAALLVSQATALWLLREYVAKPRAARAMNSFVSHLKTISAALETMDDSEERTFLKHIAEKDGIRIVPVEGMQGMRPAPDRPFLQLFRERLREVFGSKAEVYVREADAASDKPVIWVHLPMGDGSDYWVVFSRRRFDEAPVGAYVTWGAAGLAISLLASFFIIWRLNRPLRRLSQAAEEIGQGGEPGPVPESGPAEVRSVARAFNQMAEGLQRIQRERATFLAGVSHDLRTPLGHLRLEVEVQDKLDTATRSSMIADLDDMKAILEQFIDFARSEAGEPLFPVNLSELANDSAERWTRAGAQVQCELGEVPALMLRPLAMQRLVGNLLANAARHGGGAIEVHTAVSGGRAILSVLDRGPGIPPDFADYLKRPFTRVNEARSGTSGAGLGLAIADRIAKLHGGLLDLLPRDGGGLEARVTLPM